MVARYTHQNDTLHIAVKDFSFPFVPGYISLLFFPVIIWCQTHSNWSYISASFMGQHLVVV